MIGGMFLSSLFICLSICLSFVNFNISDIFLNKRDGDFTFGMHTPLMMPFQITIRLTTL